MTIYDALLFVIILLAIAMIASLIYADKQRRTAARQQKRAEENWCWSELHRTEADAARARLHVLERRYATLQTLHAEKTRPLLARNYPIIEVHVIARRGAKN